MPYVAISPSDIESLKQKLDAHSSALSVGERSLLVTVFAVAAHAIRGSEGDGASSLESTSGEEPPGTASFAGSRQPIGDVVERTLTPGRLNLAPAVFDVISDGDWSGLDGSGAGGGTDGNGGTST